MIGFLRGTIVDKTPSSLLLDVNDVGYDVNISLQTFSKIKDSEDVFLFTHLIIKEDSHTIFGFYEMEEKNMFLLLISVNGVGANTARLMLSSMSTSELKSAIMMADINRLTSIKGVGAKTAQRIVLELKDKVINLDDGTGELSALNDAGASATSSKAEAIDALVQLGITKTMAEKVVNTTLTKNPELDKVEDIIKTALQNV